jgi:hypothetical protein
LKNIGLAKRIELEFFYYVLTRHYWNGNAIYDFFHDILELNDIVNHMLFVLSIPVALLSIFIIVGPRKSKSTHSINFCMKFL